MSFPFLTMRRCRHCLLFLKVLFVAGVFVVAGHIWYIPESHAQVSCSTEILDILTGAVPRGADQNFHDEDDSVASVFQDGFDEQISPSGVDVSDYNFSHTDRTTGGLYGFGEEASGINIVVGDPDSVFGSDSDGSGYVDLELFDNGGKSYSGVFDVQVSCDNNGGYDLHIADTFNIDPALGGNIVDYNSYDIAFTSSGSINLNNREGLFRIAPDSKRDITDSDLTPGFETKYIKHEYILDLPNEADCGVMTNDDYAGNCTSTSLNPFTSLATERLREWPYASNIPPNKEDFGTIGFTLLCEQDGGGGSATSGTGKINPFTRGLTSPGTGENRVFREDGTNDDCEDTVNSPKEYYAALPSLMNGGDYDGITGTDPSTYGAILGADNWVGYSGPVASEDPYIVDNYFELRAQVPINQMSGTYGGTIILSCLPNMTAERVADFNGDGISDDPPPSIDFQTGSGSALESVTPVDIPVILSQKQSVAITVDYAITGGGATSGVDYTISSTTGTVTFPAYTDTAYIPSITIVDDEDFEGDETIEITLSNPQPSPAVLLGGITVYTYTIIDNDIMCLGPGYNWNSGTLLVSNCTVPFAGGGHFITFTTDTYCTIDGTSITLVGANSSTLYTDSCGGGTLTNNTTYTVGPFTDTAASPPDASLTFTDGYGDGGFLNVTWTYVPFATVEFALSSSSDDESVASPVINVVLDRPASGTVDYKVTGTATGGGVDYTLADGTLIFTTPTMTLPIPYFSVNDDWYAEYPETVVITLSNATSRLTLGTTLVHTYTINDNDPDVTVDFALSASSGAESVASPVINVVLGGSGGDGTVDYKVTGTATGGGVDYTLADGTLTFTTPTMTLPITPFSVNDDWYAEYPETVVITLSNKTGHLILGSTLVHTYTINDNDPDVTVDFALSASSGAESVASPVINVVLGGSGGDGTVDYKVIAGGTAGGSDYTLADGTLTFTVPTTTLPVPLKILEDSYAEFDETVVIQLSNETGRLTLGSTLVHTYTINDNDPDVTVDFALSASSGAESVASPVINVVLGGFGGDGTVDYKVTGGTAGGSDYTLADGTLIFTTPTMTLPIPYFSVNDDWYAEYPETVVITLSNKTGHLILGSTLVHTYTINDNDPNATVAYTLSSSSGDESVASPVIKVELSGPAVGTVDYKVTGGTAGGSDYTLADGTLTYTIPTTSLSLPLSIVDDPNSEPNETIIITLSNATGRLTLGSPSVHTYTIIDNDAVACLGPGYNWTSGSLLTSNCTIPSSWGTHYLTFTTDNYCTTDNTSITLVGADSSTLYSNSCGGGSLTDNTTYNVGPFTDTAASPPSATLTFTDGYGDGGLSNVSWSYQP